MSCCTKKLFCLDIIDKVWEDRFQKENCKGNNNQYQGSNNKICKALNEVREIDDIEDSFLLSFDCIIREVINS